MDSLRKKPISPPSMPSAPEQIPEPEPMQSRPIPPPRVDERSFPRVEAGIKPLLKKEELFITQEEAAISSYAEKKFQKGKLVKKIFFGIVILIAIAALAYGGYFFWKAHAVSSKMDVEKKSSASLAQDLKSAAGVLLPSERKILAGENDGRINILLLGAAGKGKPGTNLTDTLMVMSINTKDKKIGLLSLPRDLYVNIPNTHSYTKINSLYQYGLSQNSGIDPIKQTIQDITGININYYIVADFDGFQKLIDDIGGVNVTVERDIYDTRYPGPNYSYQTFELSKGFHNLDGATALKYVRERHDDPQGDFGRALRQQQVIQAVKNKVFSVGTFLNVFALNDVLNTLGDNIQTNISFDDMGSFIALSKQLDTQNITNVVVDAWKKDSLLKVSHVQVGAVRAFMLVPRVGNYSEIQDLAQNIFDYDIIKKRQQNIAEENASIAIINESGDQALATKIRTLLTDKLNFAHVKILSSKDDMVTNATTVIDNTSGQKIFSLDELIKKLPATLSSSTSTSDNQSDITIILGKDLSNTYKYEEDSLDDFNNAQDNQDNIDLLNTN